MIFFFLKNALWKFDDVNAQRNPTLIYWFIVTLQLMFTFLHIDNFQLIKHEMRSTERLNHNYELR